MIVEWIFIALVTEIPDGILYTLLYILVHHLTNSEKAAH